MAPIVASTPKHALLVCDDRQTLLGARSILESSGYRPVLSSTGTQAMRSYRERPWALVLASYDGFPITGVDLFHLLRQAPNAPQPPFVLMVKPEKREEALRRSSLPLSTLILPFGTRELAAAVARAIDPTISEPNPTFEV